MQNNSIEQQIFDAIGKAGNVLIALPQSLSGDALGSGLALAGFLRKLEKEVEIVSAAADAGPFKFLPGVEALRTEVRPSQGFILSIATAAAPLGELSYEQHSDRVDILLKSKSGRYTAADVSMRSGKPPYNLIFALDTPSLEHLGSVYEKNRDLFFETLVINIDHHPNNESYGQINLVDLTATATTEILAGLIENFESALLDEAIATNLLAGIIVETNSFQHAKTTPRSFLAASSLISAGARQQEIIRELYKTKNVGLLKLWGRALARLKEVAELGLTYSLVNLTDLEKSGSTAEDVLPVMRELVANLAGRRLILFLAEVAPREVAGYFSLHPSIRAPVVAAALDGQMLNGFLGTFRRHGADLLAVESEILEKLRKIKTQIVAE